MSHCLVFRTSIQFCQLLQDRWRKNDLSFQFRKLLQDRWRKNHVTLNDNIVPRKGSFMKTIHKLEKGRTYTKGGGNVVK